MKQGDIYWADLEPVKGHEQRGVRPVLIISGNTMNHHLGLLICCPLTTSNKGYPSCIRIQPDEYNGLLETSEVLTFHIRALSKERIKEHMGCITPTQLRAVLRGLADVLYY